MVTRGFPPATEFGGPAESVHQLSRRLGMRDHEVTVYTSNLLTASRRMSSRTLTATHQGVRVVYFNSVWQYNYAAVTPDLISWCAREISRFDVVSIYGYREFMTLVVAAWAVRHRVPYVLQPLGNLALYSRSRFKKIVYDAAMRKPLIGHAARVVARSDLEAETFPSLGVPEHKIAVVPNAIDATEFAQLPERGAFRRKLGIGERPLIVYVGRLAQIKNLHVLLRAFGAAEIPKAVLALVGPCVEPAYVGELHRLARQTGREQDVVFAGTLTGRDKLEAYVDSDVFVLPSAFETFGLAAAEAMACGVPVIVSDACGLAAAVEGRAGLVVTPGASSLARALGRMLGNREERRRFGRVARQVVLEEFSWGGATTKLEGLLEQVRRPDGRRQSAGLAVVAADATRSKERTC